jgi:DedD protein
MGLFSFLNKNKQESTGENSGYYARADDDAVAARARSKRASSAGEPARRGKEARAGADPILPEKKRARRRLVGAIALALAVAVGLPMLLDAEPKPLTGDIAIQIPSKDKAPPLPMPSDTAAAPAKVAAADALDTREEIVEPPKPAAVVPVVTAAPAVAEVRTSSTRPDTPKPEHKPAAPKAEPGHKPAPKAEPEHKPAPKAEPKPAELKPAQKVAEKPAPKPPLKADDKPAVAAKPAQSANDAARALAILEGKPAEKAPAADPAPHKFVLQIAALATQEKVNELQDKLRGAGIQSFTQKVPSPSGERIRVRVGPFGKEEAEKMRARLERLGLSGSMVPG